MSGCECKSGFFSLRDCDGAPAGSCSACGRTVCSRHLSPASGFSQCLDCHARSSQQPVPVEEPARPEKIETYDDYQRSLAKKPADGQARPKGAGEDAALDDEWTYGARHRFYSSGYHPLYTGSHYNRYYDSYDTRSFDETGAAESEVETDDGGAGFGDS
jgi:hypothetical protein